MRWVIRIMGVAAAIVALGVMAGSPAAAATADSGLGLDVKAANPTYAPGEPVRLTLTVTNTSSDECALTDQADGVVQVVSVHRDGEELVPALGRSFFDDGLGAAISAGTRTVGPGSSVAADLATVVLGGDGPGSAVLRSVVPTSSGTGLDSLWPVGAPGRYEVLVAYVMPSLDAEAESCSGTASGRVTFTVGDSAGSDAAEWPVWLIAAAGLLVVALAVLIVVLVRRGRVSAAAVLMLIGVVTVTGATGRPAQAAYVVDPAGGIPVDGVVFPGAVEACMAGFRAPGGDPAGILDRLEDPTTPTVVIVPTDGGSGAFETPESPNGAGSSVVSWNPTSTEPYLDGVARDPCAALYHELAHADDISRDQVPQGVCGLSGIPMSEVRATLAENQYRESQGLPPRVWYDRGRLPGSIDECDVVEPDGPDRGPSHCEDSIDCGRSSGDPHLVTFDRAFYDFQGVGEFVVARSTSGEALEVQARQAPAGDSRSVAVNSAVAFRVGDHSIAFALADGVSQIYIDGNLTSLPPGETTLAGGGSVLRRGADTGAYLGYDVLWPDGSAAMVDRVGTSYRLLVRLDPGRAGQVEGLLGDFDGDPTNDLKLASGSVVEQPAAFETLYPSYADSWRVTPSTSLFPYRDGESTETFTDRTYPDRDLTIEDLDDAARTRAEMACRWAGVVDPWLLAECVFDVGVTGRAEFAVATAATAHIAPPTGAPIVAAPIAQGAVTVGGEDRLAFTASVGDIIVVDVTAPTMPSVCAPIQLVDPTGAVLDRACVSGGGGFIDRIELETAGEYAVLIDGQDGLTGNAMVRVYASEDIEGTIVPNGEAVLPVLAQPGSMARYDFTAAAGQRIYLDASSATLPAQCSPLRLEDGEGQTLSTGCLAGGAGHIDAAPLPADGTYTVVFDPVGRSIGQADLRLFASTDEVGAITVDGPPVEATVDVPGSVKSYAFTAPAGTQVVVDATAATLPSGCSPLLLVGPDDRHIASSCLFGGTAVLGPVVLPDTGTYYVVVDPAAAGTGVVTLALRVA